ncbi:UDP-glycosyltransferase 88A1 [Jatropha curcas]|uniref:UDP-glycosyltransferase 88A1 n=1 Tax=Jatropha curcas TaxID=180498 RepID=UPI0018943D12|nr:UDP-glycosyltransferase 88A1 [Jatropha curcas]
MEEAIVLYTIPAMGHLKPILELGKLILTHQPSLSIHIIIISASQTTTVSISSYISQVATTIPSIKVHHLPSTNHETKIFEVIRLSNSLLHQTLLSISKSYSINALIIDFFCVASLSVVAQLNIPAYFFYSACAGSLALTLYLPVIHQNNTTFKDRSAFLDVPGLPPIKLSDLPKPVLDRSGDVYESFLDVAVGLPKSSGIIINTFEFLESREVKAILDGLGLPKGNAISPIYCVGPLIETMNLTDGGHEIEYLTWLESQPSQSVIFLCFGSLGRFEKKQLREIAIGLERSGQRFLWVVRNPPSNNQILALSTEPEPDLDSLLPKGFVDRTRERGLVVKSWATQVAVLNHSSVGGFVTHCGWNSVLEAVCAGVPMVAWPLYAEQKINKVLLVEEMKIALPIIESENGFVTALEVEERVCELMGSEAGNSVREKAIDMKIAAKAAVGEGGSSRVALSRFIESWKKLLNF